MSISNLFVLDGYYSLIAVIYTEILMSARLWTSGYDIFSPTMSLLGHHYVRNHKPKFWESIHRTFSFGVHNPLQMLS